MLKKISAAAFIVLLFSLLSTTALGNGNQNLKVIILTFDDGPRPNILKDLLPLLKKYNAPATFFVEGDIALNYKDLIRKMHEAGHEIENHSWNHENFEKLLKGKGPEAVRLNLKKTSDLIFEITGRRPQYFRPPFWVINKELEQIISPLEYKIMKLGKPDINTLDYEDASKHHSAKMLIERVESSIKNREHRGKFNHILVFHELPITIEALEILMPYFAQEGYRFDKLENVDITSAVW